MIKDITNQETSFLFQSASMDDQIKEILDPLNDNLKYNYCDIYNDRTTVTYFCNFYISILVMFQRRENFQNSYNGHM